MNLKNSPIRIAIVDDHASFADGLTMVINSRQPEMEVVGTARNRAGLEVLLNDSPDVILLDIDLGEENSMDFLASIAKSCPARILMITGVRDPSVHEEAMLRGAKGILRKDEGAAVILKAIEKVYQGEIWMDSRSMGRLFERMKDEEARRLSGNDSEGQVSDLTHREIEIVRALVTFEASTNLEIADNLNISTSTLKNHLTTIYSKLNVRNRVQLIKYALSHKIAEPPS